LHQRQPEQQVVALLKTSPQAVRIKVISACFQLLSLEVVDCHWSISVLSEVRLFFLIPAFYDLLMRR